MVNTVQTYFKWESVGAQLHSHHCSTLNCFFTLPCEFNNSYCAVNGDLIMKRDSRLSPDCCVCVCVCWFLCLFFRAERISLQTQQATIFKLFSSSMAKKLIVSCCWIKKKSGWGSAEEEEHDYTSSMWKGWQGIRKWLGPYNNSNNDKRETCLQPQPLCIRNSSQYGSYFIACIEPMWQDG